jgi:hypothetical protein
MRTLPIATVSLSLIWVSSCLGPVVAHEELVNADLIEEDARAIAASYKDWGGPVDFQLRFGPTLCFIPRVEPRFSESAPGSPHAEKLYLVHASDAKSYAGVDYSSEGQGGHLMPSNFPQGDDDAWIEELSLRRPPVPELSREWEQILVKEAFVPIRWADAHKGSSRGVLPARKGGEEWMPGARGGLYLMLRTARATPGTDEGWVYATVRADGEVTAYGQIPSCVACHRRAGPDRMFGLPGVDHEPTVRD